MIYYRYSSLLVVLLVTLLATSCSNLTPTENGLLAAGVAGAASGVALGTTVSPAISIPVSIGAALLAGGGTYLYAQHRATIDQRRIAEARARLYYAELSAQEQQRAGRYLAVNAPNRPKNQGQAVMLYDTQTGAIANNTAYDLKKTPAIGQSTALGNTSATYIGSGN